MGENERSNEKVDLFELLANIDLLNKEIEDERRKEENGNNG